MYVCAWYLWETKAAGIPGAGVMIVCELSCECWELNLGPLEEQAVFVSPRAISPASIFTVLSAHLIKYLHSMQALPPASSITFHLVKL